MLGCSGSGLKLIASPKEMGNSGTDASKDMLVLEAEASLIVLLSILKLRLETFSWPAPCGKAKPAQK